MSQGFGRSNFPDMALIDFVFKEGSKHGFGRNRTGLKIADLFRDSNAEAKNYSSQTVYRRLHYHIRLNIARYDVSDAVRQFFFYQKDQTDSDSTTDDSDDEDEQKPDVSGLAQVVAGSSRTYRKTPGCFVDPASSEDEHEGHLNSGKETPGVKDEYDSSGYPKDDNAEMRTERLGSTSSNDTVPLRKFDLSDSEEYDEVLQNTASVMVASNRFGQTEDFANPEYSISASEASSSASSEQENDEPEETEDEVDVQSTKSVSPASSKDDRRKDFSGPNYSTPVSKEAGSSALGEAENNADDVVILWANVGAEKDRSAVPSSAKRPHEEEVRVKVEKPDENTVEDEEVQIIHEYARRVGITAEEALYVSAKKSKVFDKIMAGWKVKSESAD